LTSTDYEKLVACGSFLFLISALIAFHKCIFVRAKVEAFVIIVAHPKYIRADAIHFTANLLGTTPQFATWYINLFPTILHNHYCFK